MTDYDVVIVGAGLSGLSAARILKNTDPSIRVLVLEANDRVGGRTQIDETGADLGAGYVGPTQDRIMSLVDHFGLKLQKINTQGKTVQYLNGSVRHYDGIIPPVNLLGVVDLGAIMATMAEESEQINLTHPHLSGSAYKWDRMNVEQYICRNLWTEDAKKLSRTGIRVVLCCDPAEVSALAWLWYIKQSGGVKRIFETKDGAQDCTVQGGAGQIAQLLAKELGGDTMIRRSAPVRRIDYSDPGKIVLSGFGFSVTATYVILAIPPMQQHRVDFCPALDHLRCQSLQRYPMGHVMKTFMYYDKPFWREKGLNGQIVCDEGISCVTIESIKPDGSKPCMMGFVFPEDAADHPTSTMRQTALGIHYANVFAANEARHPIAYKEKNWAEEPWAGGCIGLMGPGAMTKYRMAHREPIQQRIYMAGTENAYRMVGYMDGAVEAGERIARNVLVAMGRLPASQYDQVSNPLPSPQLPFVKRDLSFLERHSPSLPQVASVIVAVVVMAVVGIRYLLIEAKSQQEL